MKKVIQILTLLNLSIFATGLYYQYYEHDMIYSKIMGIGVLILVFILMPIFLFYRYKDKNIDDYRFKGFNKDTNE